MIVVRGGGWWVAESADRFRPSHKNFTNCAAIDSWYANRLDIVTYTWYSAAMLTFCRILVLSVIIAISAQSAQAGPISWIKRQFKEHPTRTALIVGVGAATAHGLALAHCRQGSVEACEAQYGAAWKSYSFAVGTNFSLIAVSHGCRKNEGGKFCNLLAYGGSAVEAGFSINQWNKRTSSDESLLPKR